MADRMNVLVLTDSTLHGAHEGIYMLLQSLNRQDQVKNIYICDRNDADNAHFYRDRIAVGGLHVFEMTDHYAYETRHAHSCTFTSLDKFDAIWMFLDHPVSPECLQYLCGVFPKIFFMNNPQGILHTSSKSVLADMLREIDCINEYLPPIKVCTSLDDVEIFRAEHGDTVLKALRDFGGAGVKRYKDGDTDLRTPKDVQKFLDKQNGQCLAMQYLDNLDQSDKRTLVFKGQILGSVLRRPAEDGWLCNIASGGTAEMSSANREEKILIDVLDPWLQKKGIYYYGIDTLKDAAGRRVLSEINTLNIGGAKIIQDLSGLDVSETVAAGFCALYRDYCDAALSRSALDEWSDFFSDFG